MDALRERSVRLTAFLERLLDVVAARRPIEVITPRDPSDGARSSASWSTTPPP